VVIEASGNVDNISRVFRRIGPRGRVMLLGRSGAPLAVDAVDHMITQAVSIMGSRGHLGVPLSRTLALHQDGLLPLDGVVTSELGSLDALFAALSDPDNFARSHCKVIARLNGRSSNTLLSEASGAFP
jgi:threonine dehydrogenase-like Zn-dependent dehydrogenase